MACYVKLTATKEGATASDAVHVVYPPSGGSEVDGAPGVGVRSDTRFSRRFQAEEDSSPGKGD
jgi:hypothetical protein